MMAECSKMEVTRTPQHDVTTFRWRKVVSLSKNTKQTVVKSMIDSKSYDFHIFARQNRKCSQDESSSIQTWNCWL